MISDRIIRLPVQIELNNEEVYKVLLFNNDYILLQHIRSGDYYLVLSTLFPVDMEIVYKALRMLGVYDIRIAVNCRYTDVYCKILQELQKEA